MSYVALLKLITPMSVFLIVFVALQTRALVVEPASFNARVNGKKITLLFRSNFESQVIPCSQ